MTEIHGRHSWVDRLAASGAVDLDRTAGPRALVEDAVARVGTGPVEWAVELSAMVAKRIVAEVPALGGSPAAVELLRRGNEATTLRALLTLVEGPAAALPAGEATLEGIREFVHRGIPLAEVLRGVRVGHAATTEAFLRTCVEVVDPAVAAEEVTATSRDLFAYVDDLSDVMVRTYLVEHEVWSTSAAAARADIVRSLLRDAVAVDAGEASQVLGYDLRRTHQAVVVWSDSPERGPALQAAAVGALRARGATATLVVPVASGRLWAWGAVPARTEPGGPRPADPVPVDPGPVDAALAFGTPADGVEGFRRSHREAERGERVERLRREAGQAPRAATDYGDIAVVALLAGDLAAAAEFVGRELGGLAARTAATAALRTTLYHYLDTERSLVAVARRLHVARGTVTYRVNRAQELLGHELDGRLALRTALALAEELGDAVLPREV